MVGSDQTRYHRACSDVIELEDLGGDVTGERAFIELSASGIGNTRSASDRQLAYSEGELRRLLRDALRSLHNDARLAKSPLMRTKMLPNGNHDPRALRAALMDTCASLGEVGDNATLRRVLDASYCAGRRKQSVVASDLGMSLSTYRRRLNDAMCVLARRLLLQLESSEQRVR